MQRRQSRIPRQWLITDERLGDRLLPAIRRLPLGSGVLLRHRELPKGKRQRLKHTIRRLGRVRKLMLVDEAEGAAVRVHNSREIARAQLEGASLLLLSPVYPTRSHPDWQPLPQMRAVALLRLAKRPVLALGGMNEKRFARVRALGFYGWAGIDAWIRT